MSDKDKPVQKERGNKEKKTFEQDDSLTTGLKPGKKNAYVKKKTHNYTGQAKKDDDDL